MLRHFSQVPLNQVAAKEHEPELAEIAAGAYPLPSFELRSELKEREDKSPGAGSHIPDDTKAVVPVSDIIVHGLGGLETILQELQNIAAASSHEPHTPRKHGDKDEFAALVHRVQCRQATVVLRKLFLYRGECNVMQEIWIADKSNPDATANPHKAYSVVHVHHHAAVAHAQDVKLHHLDVVDAMNARHLAARGSGYQGDNPFFQTYIEPSGRDTLKIFPAKEEWECGKCGQKNFQSKPLCRGKRGTVCSGLRPCVAWKWRQQTSLDEGMAQVLKCADDTLQWVSGSGKSHSLHRVTGDSSEGRMAFCPGFSLEELRKKYDASCKKGIPKTCNAEAAAAPLSSPWIEPDWSQFDPPAHISVSKLTILFVGVDNGSCKDPDLNLNAEYDNIERAYEKNFKSHSSTLTVDVRRLYYSSWHEVMVGIRKEQPTILHFGCHSQKETGFELFRETVTPSKILTAISSYNDDARERNPPRPDIRLIVLNACESDVHAFELTACVDFAIGHQHPVLDKDAIEFSRLLYDCIFDGATLLNSFHQAKGVLDGYMLKGQRNPRKFRFLLPADKGELKKEENVKTSGSPSEAVASSALRGASQKRVEESATRYIDPDKGVEQELIMFLESQGLTKIARKFCDKLEIERKENLKWVTQNDINDLEPLYDWQRKTLLNCIQLVQGAVAEAMTPLGDSDVSIADTASEASESLGDMSESSDSEASGSENDPAQSIVAGYNLENKDKIQANLKKFLHFLMDDNPLKEAHGNVSHGNVSLCTILWISFLKEATYLDTKVGFFQKWMDRLCDGTSPIEDDIAKEVDSCVRDLVSHKLLGSIRSKMNTFSTRPCVASIAIIDQMVAVLLVADEARLAKWNQIVVSDWYDSSYQVPGVFLARANNFLRDDVGSVQLLACVQTQSCVAFLRMPRLAAHIFFEYLDVSKRKSASSAGAAGAAESSTSLWHGFRLFVSNTRSMSSLTRADVPARSALRTVRHGLECLARLPSQTWETIVAVKTIKDPEHVKTGHSRSRVSANGKMIYVYVNL